MQNDITIFQKEYAIIDGFVTAPSGESIKVFAPRSKVNGRRVNMAQMLEIVRDYFQAGKSGSAIAKIIEKDSDTIGKYKKMIEAFGALDESAIIKDRENQAEFRNEETSEMLVRPEVKAWYDTLIENGKNKKVTKTFAASVNRVSKILQISPVTLCQLELADGSRTSREQLLAINKLMFVVKEQVNSESSFYAVRMAVRSWLQFNGVTIPRGNLCPANLSGKIISTHGAAANIRASEQEIEQVRKLLGGRNTTFMQYGKLPFPNRRQDTLMYFEFGIETGARHMTTLTAMIDQFDASAKTIEVIERKLSHVGKHRQTRRIFCPELIALIEAKIKAGEKCVIGAENEYMPFSEMGKTSSDDLHQTKQQADATKEIGENLRAVYQQVGGNLAKAYYTKKPFHSLRHIAAQVWLDKSDYDYGFVAELLGWSTIDELKTSYGGISGDRFARKYNKYIQG
jgi:integrase